MKHTLVTLVDGQVVTSDAELWRHQCLAQHVLNLPGLATRQEWLADFERRHGKDDTDRLKATMLELRQKARATA